MTEPFVLDKAYILENLGGDEDIYQMMVDMFLQDLDSYCANLQAAFASGSISSVQREAHTIKGLLASFGDAAGAKEAYVIESQAKQGSIGGLEGKVSEVQARLREVAGVLTA